MMPISDSTLSRCFAGLRLFCKPKVAQYLALPSLYYPPHTHTYRPNHLKYTASHLGDGFDCDFLLAFIVGGEHFAACAIGKK